MDGNRPKNVLRINPSVKALSGTDTGGALFTWFGARLTTRRLNRNRRAHHSQRGIDDLGERESVVDARYRLSAFLGLTRTWTVFSCEFGVMPMTNSSMYS